MRTYLCWCPDEGGELHGVHVTASDAAAAAELFVQWDHADLDYTEKETRVNVRTTEGGLSRWRVQAHKEIRFLAKPAEDS